MFVALNLWRWMVQPGVDNAERTVLAIAAGDMNEADVAAWLRGFLGPS